MHTTLLTLLGFVSVVVVTSLREAQAVTLQTGETYEFTFDTLEYQGAQSILPQITIYFGKGADQLDPGQHFTYELFSNNFNEQPFSTGSSPIVSSTMVSSSHDNAWQNLQGAVRMTVTSGPITFPSIWIKVLTGTEIYQSTFVLTNTPAPAANTPKTIFHDLSVIRWSGPSPGAGFYGLSIVYSDLANHRFKTYNERSIVDYYRSNDTVEVWPFLATLTSRHKILGDLEGYHYFYRLLFATQSELAILLREVPWQAMQLKHVSALSSVADNWINSVLSDDYVIALRNNKDSFMFDTDGNVVINATYGNNSTKQHFTVSREWMGGPNPSGDRDNVTRALLAIVDAMCVTREDSQQESGHVRK